MLTVQLQATPAQTVQVQLAGQPCVLNVYQKAYGLFMDVYVAGTLIVGGVICLNLNRIARSLYLGFQGDLLFEDTQGSNDPDYTGLGGRYQLVYLAASELPAGAG